MPPPVKSTYTWDAVSGRYRDLRTGTYTSWRTVRSYVDRALHGAEADALSLTAKLRTGTASLEEWRAGMRALIKDVHFYNAATARGGWAQLTQSDYGRLGQIVRRHYEYLERLSAGLADGTIRMDGRLLQRVRYYMQAGRSTHHAFLAADALARGFNEERNVLGDADHCADCVAQRELGWVRIGTLKPVGGRDCMVGCQCRIIYRKSPAKE